MYGQPKSIDNTPLRGQEKEFLLRFSIDNFLARNKNWKKKINTISNGASSFLTSIEKIKCLSKGEKHRTFSDIFTSLNTLKIKKLESLKRGINTLDDRLKRLKNNRCPFNCQEVIAKEQIEIESKLERIQKEFLMIKQLIICEKEKYNE